jgi:hypothetical protein
MNTNHIKELVSKIYWCLMSCEQTMKKIKAKNYKQKLDLF